VFEVYCTTFLVNGKEKTANPQKMSSFSLVFDICFFCSDKKVAKVFH